MGPASVFHFHLEIAAARIGFACDPDMNFRIFGLKSKRRF
jgi:hypothetical protein